MEDNKNSKNTIILLFFIIFILFFILMYSWLNVFGIIDNNSVNVISMLDQTEQDTKENKNRKIVVDKKEEKEVSNNSLEEKDKILEQLKSQSVLYEENNNTETTLQIDTSKFYYAQIDDNAKIIYNKLVENKENLKKGNFKIECGNVFTATLSEKDGAENLKKSYSQAVRAFLFDNPEIFFLDVPKLCLITQSKTSIMSKEYNVFITAEEGSSYLNTHFPTEAIINSAQSKINDVVNEILKNTEGYTVADKIEYVHDYLVKNVEYDSSLEKASIHDVYGALVNNVAVCEGYSKSFKYILDKMGIPSIIVVGNAQNVTGELESHSWNYVNIDGKWYGVDTTFDDPIIVGDFSNSFDNIRYKYFLKGNDVFSKIHTIDPMEILEFSVDYPILEEESYN